MSPSRGAAWSAPWPRPSSSLAFQPCSLGWLNAGWRSVMGSDESERSKTLEYEYVEDLEAKVLDLEVQVSRFAGRVDQLVRQRAGLVRLLRDIKTNGGCTTRHWRYIDRLLATGSWEFDGEDSGRH